MTKLINHSNFHKGMFKLIKHVLKKYSVFKTTYWFLVVLTTTIGCDTIDYKLKIVNESPCNIVFSYSEDSIYDTTVDPDIDFFLSRKEVIHQNDTQGIVSFGEDSWIGNVRFSKYKCIFGFVFNYDTLEKYRSMKYILENNLYTRYKLTETYLNAHHWIVTYPPNDLLYRLKSCRKNRI